MTDNENKTMTVYVICHKGSKIGKECYVGSTSQALARRLSAHRSRAFRPGNEENKLYTRMREIGLRNCVIHPLETKTCSEYEIRKLERAWCEKLRSDLNSVSPIRLGKERSGPAVQTVYLLHNRNSTGKDCYVGSTVQTLARRLSAHKSNACQPGNENNKLYRRMRKVGLENWVIRLLESKICSNDDIRKLERDWCEILHSDLNTRLPFQTNEEQSEYCEAYRVVNREVIRKKSAAYYAANREKLAAYYLTNRKTIREKTAARREKIKESKKFFCKVCDITCGSKRDLKNHNETLKHQFTFLNSLD